jgi:hypothetical protein
MNVELIKRSTARTHLVHHLRLPRETAIQTVSDEVIAEYLRTTLVALTHAGESVRPVYVTSITNQVRTQLVALWPELARIRNQRPSEQEQRREGDKVPDPIRRVLEALSDLREAVHIGNGHWLPGPVRFVDMGGGRVLLVGGVSTAGLRGEFPQLRPEWIARRIDHVQVPQPIREDPAWWQALDTWLGSPPESLEQWTAEYLQHARASLAQSASDLTDFEVYAPELRRRDAQAFRWIASDEIRHPPADLVLCRNRFTGFMAPRRYWFGILKPTNQGVRVEREAPVGDSDVRRLQYGLDQWAHSPTRVAVQPQKQRIILTLRNLLPPEERRLLIAFGEERSKARGRFPLEYAIGRDVYPPIEAKLRALGIEVPSPNQT